MADRFHMHRMREGCAYRINAGLQPG
jgi:hypothetical protein